MRLELNTLEQSTTTVYPILKTDISLTIFGVFQDNFDAPEFDENGNQIVGYQNFYGFWFGQDKVQPYLTNDSVINKLNLKPMKRLFNRKFIDSKSSSLYSTIVNNKKKDTDFKNHVLFDSYESAQAFIDQSPKTELYKPIIIMVEVPSGTPTIHCKNGIILAETYKLLY